MCLRFYPYYSIAMVHFHYSAMLHCVNNLTFNHSLVGRTVRLFLFSASTQCENVLLHVSLQTIGRVLLECVSRNGIAGSGNIR